jgi:DNA-binding NarL/FixJ family response regulator
MNMPDGASEKDQLQVLIVDDHDPYRHAIAEVINAEVDMCVRAEASDGEQAELLAQHLWPNQLDLILMDIDMPRMDGITAVSRINTAFPDLPIIMLTVSELDENLFMAIRAGAVGYLSKGLSPSVVVRALREYHLEQALPMSRVMARKVLAYFQGQIQRTPSQTASSAGFTKLSRREHEVLELIARGARDREIAAQLVLTERTVKKHVEHILRKLHARNRAEAAAHLRDAR